jgi:hypothetical protein
LKLWVNGIIEDSAPCGDAESTTGGTRYVVVAGGAAPFTDQVPLGNSLLNNTQIGRFIVANRGLTDAEMLALYAEFKTMYPGLP